MDSRDPLAKNVRNLIDWKIKTRIPPHLPPLPKFTISTDFLGLDVSASVGFRGDGYIELRQDLAGEKSQEANNIVIEFSTTEDGLLYWHGQEARQNGYGQDYLAVAGKIIIELN